MRAWHFDIGRKNIFVEEGGGVGGFCEGVQGVVGDAAGELVAELEVELFGGAAGGGVESEERAVVFDGFDFEGLHELAGDAFAAGCGVDEELGDLGAVGLVGGRVEEELDGAEDIALAFGEEEAAVGHVEIEPVAAGVVEGEGEDEADAGAGVDGGVEDLGEGFEGGGGEVFDCDFEHRFY